MVNIPPGAVIAKQKLTSLNNEAFGEESIENGIFNISNKTNLYAIGDIHGDSLLLKHILVNLAKVCEFVSDDLNIYNSELDDIRWKINESSYMVFCGDLIDRTRDIINNISLQDENSDLEIIKTLDRLDKEARNYGGRVLMLLGNHELMNFQGNFDFVSSKGRYMFRELDFIPGSLWAKYISDNCFALIRINNLLFVHGGFCINFLRQIKKLNFDSNVLINLINLTLRNYLKNLEFTPKLLKIKELLESYNSIFFCRDFGFNKYNCDDLDEIFSSLNMDSKLSKMIIGHSVQNEINSICDNRVWRIDVGASRAFNTTITDFDYELIEHKLTADNGEEWLIKYLNELIINFNTNSNNTEKNMSILRFYYDDNFIKMIKDSDTIYSDHEIISQRFFIFFDDYMSLIDDIIKYFTLNDKKYHVQILNKIRSMNLKYYEVSYEKLDSIDYLIEKFLKVENKFYKVIYS